MNWTIRNRLIAGCGVLVTVLAVACLLGWQQAVSSTSASGQVSSSSQSLAEGSSEQAASIEETSASLEEMASMTKRNAENASKANELTRQTRTAAEESAAAAEELNAQAHVMKEAVTGLQQLCGISANNRVASYRAPAPAKAHSVAPKPATKPHANGHAPSNGASPVAPMKPGVALATASPRRSENPMEGDFREFWNPGSEPT